MTWLELLHKFAIYYAVGLAVMANYTRGKPDNKNEWVAYLIVTIVWFPLVLWAFS